MRLREDHWWEPGKKRAIALNAIADPRKDAHKNWDPTYIRYLNDDTFEAAQLGDVWVLRRSPSDGKMISYVAEGHEDWPITGYALTCPNEQCEEGVHAWTHASDCEGDYGRTCKRGAISCWTWTGDIEDDTLTANPSLFVNHKSCGWHGFLQNGQMNGAVEAKYLRAS